MEFLIVIPATLFLIYQSLAGLMIIDMPVINFGTSSAMLQVASLVIYKWGIILGLFGLIYSIAGYLSNKKAVNTKMSGAAIGLAICYYILCFISVI